MGLNLDASPEEMKLFLEEAEEHFQTLEEDLVRLEKEEEFNEEMMQEIFRASHTLKGSSATIGHNRMAQLTHSMENVLDKMRKRQLSVTREVVDVLFECLDCLRVLRDEIIDDEESDLELTGIIAKLSSIIDSGEAPTVVKAEEVPTAEKSGPQGAKQQISMELSWDDKDAILKASDQGQKPFMVRVKFDVEQEMLSVRAFVTLMAFGEVGDVIKSKPTSDEIEADHVTDTLLMLLLSNEEDKVRKLISDLPNISESDVLPFSDDMVAEAVQTESETTVVEVVKVEEKAVEEAAEEAAAPTAAAKTSSQSKVAANNKKINRTVRVDVELLDSLMNLMGELVIDRTRLFQIHGNIESNYEMDDVSQDLGRTAVHISRVTTQLQEQIMKARMLPVENLFNKFPRMVRDLSQKAGKEVDFIMTGQETELDRSIIEEIGDPLIHLLRNAVDHGIESAADREAKGKNRLGTLKLQASHEENHIIIVIRDDGKGIDPEAVRQSGIKKGLITEEQAKRMTDKEAINLIFMSGLSTVAKVTDVSGRGVGMDVVRTNIEKINGAIEITSAVGKGTEFKIKLPLTLAIIRALLVTIEKSVFAIPLSTVTETIRLRQNQIEYVNNQEVIVVRGKILPLVRLKKIFVRNMGGTENGKIFVVVVNLAGQQVGLVVDSLVGEQEIVIKSLGKYIGDVQGISGATILGDGNVALIVDVSNLVKKVAS
jgi:two-component system chemotaxis sensor kinase CheA